MNDAIAAQATDDFHTKYRRAALLVIEDIARLDGRQAVQEELLYTIDALLGSGGRLIATAGTGPSQWRDFLPAVTARLTSGLVVPLRSPSKAVRKLLLEQLAAMNSTPVGDGVLDILADQLAVTAPELLGAGATPITGIARRCRPTSGRLGSLSQASTRRSGWRSRRLRRPWPSNLA